MARECQPRYFVIIGYKLLKIVFEVLYDYHIAPQMNACLDNSEI